MQLNICQSDLASIADTEKVMAAMAQCGFRRVRFEVPFHSVYAWPWKQDWAGVKRVKAAADKYGLQLLPTLGAHFPFWWRPGPDKYAQFCCDALELLQTDRCELWNEPNLFNFWKQTDPTSFALYEMTAYRAIKAKFGGNVKVLMAGLAASDNSFVWPILGGNKNPLVFMDGMVKASGGQKFYDALAYHPYCLDAQFNFREPAADLFGIKMIGQLKEKYGAEVVLTEMGFLAQHPQADWFSKEIALLPPESEVYLYCWRDTGGETYGLVDTNNTRRQPYFDTVMATLAKLQEGGV